MPSPHKNAGDEYLVHTDAPSWQFFGPSASSLRVKQLEKELDQQKLDNTKLKDKYNQLSDLFNIRKETLKNVEFQLECLKVHQYFLEK
jgi:hypothetical protein